MAGTWAKLFAQLANAILAAGSIGIARACGADAQTAIAIGTIIGTTAGSAANGIIDVTTKDKNADNGYYVIDFNRSKAK